MIYLKCLLITACLVGPSLSQQRRAEFQLFDQNNGQGYSTKVSYGNINDLTSQGFDNRARSVCGLGIWLFYQDINFHPNGRRPVEWKFSRDYRCVNLQIVDGRLSSVRYSGSSADYNVNSITLYQHDHFQGRQFYLAGNHDGIAAGEGQFNSVIVTGNSDWTLYPEPNYRGVAVCLRMAAPRDFTPSLSTDLRGMFGGNVLKDGIRSVRMGCTRGQTYLLTRFSSN